MIGIEDWAWKKGHRDGTIICDRGRHRGIEIVSRDRGGGYWSPIARALPGARQLADRWHLLENASRAFVDTVRKSPGDIRRALTKKKISPA